jgi:hypothetical protein
VPDKPLGRRTYKKRRIMGGPILPPLGAARAVLGQKALAPDVATFAGERLTGLVAGPVSESSKPKTMMARTTAMPRDTSATPTTFVPPPAAPLYVHPMAKTKAATPGPALPKGHKKGTGRGRSGGARPV